MKNLETITAELKKLKIKTDGEPEQEEFILPDSLESLPWVLIQRACQDGGYDLFRYAGQNVLMTSFPITQNYR